MAYHNIDEPFPMFCRTNLQRTRTCPYKFHPSGGANLVIRPGAANRLRARRGDDPEVVQVGGMHPMLNSLPQEKLVALRQCIDRVHIDKPANKIKLGLRVILSASLAGSVIVSRDMDAS